MKRFGSSDSLVPFLYPQEGNMQMMMDGLEDEESMEEIGHVSGKKRRLGVDQVQSLEKIFEVDNKLDPERKSKLARELNLQPRQVAIWFQNRRARWKTKQLERDYNHLKADYENLQHSFSEIQQEKQNLVTELNGLKEKLGVKRGGDEEKCDSLIFPLKPKMATNSLEINEVPELKDGSSDESDNSSNGFLQMQNNNLSPKILSDDISCSEANPAMCLSSSMYYPQFLDLRPPPSAEAHHHHYHHPQQQQYQEQEEQHNAKMEVVNLFGVDEPCNMFSSVDQSQNSLYWCYYDQRI